MQESFGDFDPEFDAWQDAHPCWREAGLAAAHQVAAVSTVFTTVDVWRHWQGPFPPEPRAMAGVMGDAIAAGYCARRGVVGGHTRRNGHPGFGSVYESLIYQAEAS